MAFEKYTTLLDSSENPVKNFLESVKFTKRAIFFNFLLKILDDSDCEYKVIKGFNYQSDDLDYKTFKKIMIELDEDGVETIEYSVLESFSIAKIEKNIYIIECLL